jgi:hypothetical protein
MYSLFIHVTDIWDLEDVMEMFRSGDVIFTPKSEDESHWKRESDAYMLLAQYLEESSSTSNQ